MASDTTPAAQEAQVIAARRLGHAGRLMAAAELSEDVRRVSTEGVLRRNPSYTFEQARREVLRRVWGRGVRCSRLAARGPTSSLQEFLERIAPALRNAGVPFMIAGSFASAAHGLPRSTNDLDIVIDPSREALDSLLAALPSEAYYVDSDAAHDALQRRGMFNVIDHATGWKIDFIFRKNRSFSRQELERRAR